MSKRASPALIGSFVVGAITLVIVIVVLVGAGRLFHKTQSFILYFKGDVNGLKVGAPVKFRGIEIGTVTNILINVSDVERWDTPVDKFRIPVIIELDEARFREKGARPRLANREILKLLIDRGLRAQLRMESFLTGMLYVTLDMFPDTPVELVGEPTVQYPEIPTIPRSIEEAQAAAHRILKTLDRVDFAKLMESITNITTGLDKLVNAPELKTTLQSVNKAVENLHVTITSFRETAYEIKGNIGPIATKLNSAADSADAAIKEARGTIASLNTTLQPDSPLMYQLRTTLEGLSATARTVRSLADYLERNPSALIRGKAESEGNQ